MKYPSRKDSYVVSRETAIEQFMLLIDYYDVDMNAFKDRGEGGEAAFEILDAQNEKFVTQIQRGRLSVYEEDGAVFVKQILVKPVGDDKVRRNEIVYQPLNNSHVIASDKFDRRNEPTLRKFAFMGAVSKCGSDVFRNMAIGADSTAMEQVYTFFTWLV